MRKSCVFVVLLFCIIINAKSQINVIPEQKCLEFFSVIIIQQLEFKKGDRIYFKGETEDDFSNYFGVKKELMIFENNENLFYELEKIQEKKITKRLKLDVSGLDVKKFSLKCKRMKDYELLIYKSLELNDGNYFTKMVLSNSYKGITIFLLTDKSGKIKFQLNSFII